MALITSFEHHAGKAPRTHRTQLVGHWSALRENGRTSLLQIDTLGSEQRANPDKQSQTIQLDRQSASALFDILKREFGF